jgi:hypothetical protein
MITTLAPPAGNEDRAPASVASRPSTSGKRRWLRRGAVAAVAVLVAVELFLAWPSLTGALSQLRTPQPAWLAAAVALEVGAMTAYARMQRRLLISAGVRAPLRKHVALAYAAHALSASLPAGPAFSTNYNYQRMRRFGATPAVASWGIALSGILSAAALAVITAGGALTAHGTPPWWTLAGLAVAAAAVTLGAQRLAHRPDALAAVLARVNRLARRPADSGLDRIGDFAAQLRAARLTPRHGTAAVAQALLNWLLDAACLWMCSRAVGDTPLAPTAVLLAFCAAMSVGTLTVVPGGLGVIDSALVLGLTRAGAATPAAIATAVLYRLISLGLIVGTGWIIWAADRRHQKPTA